MKRLYTIILYLSLAGPLMAQDAPGTITSVVSYSETGAGGTVAPGGGLAVDIKGDFYVGPRIYLPDGNIRLFLGGPSDGSRTRDFGDGLPANTYGFARTTAASESGPSITLTVGMTVDLKGNIYIAASYDQRVRRVGPDGIIWTAAGSGDRIFPTSGTRDSVQGGFSGDGGPATQAQLNKPADVALDAQGNLYIADCGNGRIRLVNREGYISTFAGNGVNASSTTGDGGPAVFAFLNTPVSVAVDLKGNIYVAELYAHRVRRIAPDDQHTITTFAGTGEPGFSGDGGPAIKARLNDPMGIAVDVEGNVYIADRENHRVRKVDLNGIITTFAGNGLSGGLGPLGDGGVATQARVERPRDVAVDAKGYVYISNDADGASRKVRRVSPLKSFEIPLIRLSTTSMSFATTSVNTAVEQTFTVSNAGKETPLLVEAVTDKYAPEFKVVSQTNFLVQPGGSQTVTVRYTPTSLSSTSSTLSVYHSGVEDKPLTVRLNAVPGTTKSADFTGDGKVDFDDFFLFAAAFGQSATEDNAKFDLDGNGKIDFDDFFLFAGRLGKTGGMS